MKVKVKNMKRISSNLSSSRMKKIFLILFVLCCILLAVFTFFHFKRRNESNKSTYNEKHRPQFHFSPPTNWMNDPNGLVYSDGVFHLFYQFHPKSRNWGPMHWGHAVSSDLLHWQHKPIALAPNKLGTIFSGSALVDINNVTGLQMSSSKVLIAIFTQHFQNETINQLQQQSLAYSNDGGLNWSFYEFNPILKNPGILDFRDPKVIYYKDYYIMVLAAGDRIMFYKSFNLFHWMKLSEFGVREGSHSGVWECPDLFKIHINEKDIWVLLVSTNPGGPNGGSATQYFLGNFDGTTFVNTNSPKTILWLDYGPDSYAGVTWFGTSSNNHLFIAWMNNWNYANFVPSKSWRGQMTIPRNLRLQSLENGYFISSSPVNETYKLRYSKPIIALSTVVKLKANQKISFSTLRDVNKKIFDIIVQFDVEDLTEDSTVELCLRNDISEQICVRYLIKTNLYLVDRSLSGNVTFHHSYNFVSTAPRLLNSTIIDWRLLLDVSSLEVFADNGLTTLTSLYYSNSPFTILDIRVMTKNETSISKLIVKSLIVYNLRSVWL